MDYVQFEKRCRRIGISPSACAINSGVSKSTISKWKIGQTFPNYTSMEKIETYLKQKERELGFFSDTELFYRTADNQPPQYPEVPQSKVITFAPDNSMLLDAIPKGAEITVIPTEHIEENAIVFVSVNGTQYIRHYAEQGDMVVLTSSNPKYPPILISKSSFDNKSNKIYGVCDKVTFHIN